VGDSNRSPTMRGPTGRGRGVRVLSERVTWETCPGCRRPAAVGWVDGDPVGFDCPRECTLSAGELRAAFMPGRRVSRLNH
jgi:hypothetical protein